MWILVLFCKWFRWPSEIGLISLKLKFIGTNWNLEMIGVFYPYFHTMSRGICCVPNCYKGKVCANLGIDSFIVWLDLWICQISLNCNYFSSFLIYFLSSLVLELLRWFTICLCFVWRLNWPNRQYTCSFISLCCIHI